MSMRLDVWVPIAVAGLSAGPAYIALVLRKIHHQVNGQDETLSTMVFETSKAVGRIEQKLEDHVSSHGADGR